MSLILTAALLVPLDCQAGPQDPPAAERARWIEADAVREGVWLGWSSEGPRRAEPPLHGPWLALEFTAPVQTPAGGAWTLELAGGGVLRGEPGPELPGSAAPAWRLACRGAPPFAFDSLWLRGLGRGAAPPADPLATEDRLWLLRPGGVLDLQRGWLLDWTAAGPEFQSAAGERVHPWQEVQALRVLDEDVDEPQGTVWLFLADGSTLAARVLGQDPRGAEGADWRVEFPWGARTTLPADSVLRVRRRSGVEEWGRADWEVRGQPRAGELDWTPKRGRSVEGRALRLGGRTWPDGWGVKAPSELARRAPGAGTLLLTVGADDRVAEFRQPQPIVFRVLLDDEELASTPPLTVADGPRTLLVAVPRAGLLRLIAQTPTPLTQGAHADWCDLLWLPASERP